MVAAELEVKVEVGEAVDGRAEAEGDDIMI
jgi:hypothetical protein